MSYEKQTWKTGDVITAVKLNHMEDGIANPGYTVETQAVAVVPEQSVTTKSKPSGIAANLALAEGIEEFPASLTITFNGTQYECEAVTNGGDSAYYGGVGETGPDFSEYPFVVRLDLDPIGCTVGAIYTESAGTYTVKAEDMKKVAVVSEDFALARGYSAESRTVEVVPEQSVTTVTGQGFPNAFSAQINLAEGITYNDIPDTLTITFQGQEYVCSNSSSDFTMKNYGAPMVDGVPDWRQYPFIVSFELEAEKVLVTESAGTYTVKATAESKTVTPSDEFKQAVNMSVVVPTPISSRIDVDNKTINNTAELTVGENTITKTFSGDLDGTSISKIISIDPIFSDSTTLKLKDFSARFINITRLKLTWIFEATQVSSLFSLNLRIVKYSNNVSSSGGGEVMPITPITPDDGGEKEENP